MDKTLSMSKRKTFTLSYKFDQYPDILKKIVQNKINQCLCQDVQPCEKPMEKCSSATARGLCMKDDCMFYKRNQLFKHIFIKINNLKSSKNKYMWEHKYLKVITKEMCYISG